MGSNICLSVSWLPQWYPSFGWAKGGENEMEEGSEDEELMGTSYEHVPGRREREDWQKLIYYLIKSSI